MLSYRESPTQSSPETRLRHSKAHDPAAHKMQTTTEDPNTALLKKRSNDRKSYPIKRKFEDTYKKYDILTELITFKPPVEELRLISVEDDKKNILQDIQKPYLIPILFSQNHLFIED